MRLLNAIKLELCLKIKSERKQKCKYIIHGIMLNVMMHNGYRKVSNTLSQNFTRETLNLCSLGNQITCKILYTNIAFMAVL